MTELFDSWGIPVQTRVYFTFTYDKKDYVYADELFSDEEEPEGECSRLGWGILRGAHIKTEEPSEDALEFCRTILARAEKEPEKYPLQGEHYTASAKEGRDGREKEASRLRVTKSSECSVFDAFHSFLSFGFKWIIVLAVAIAYGLLVFNNLGWGRALFPEGTSESTVKVLYMAIQILGSSYFYLTFKPYRWVLPMILMGIMPFVCFCALVTVITNTVIRWLIIAGLVLFAVGILFPQFNKLINGGSVQNKVRVIENLRFLAVCSLIVAATVGFFGGIISGVDGYVYPDSVKDTAASDLGNNGGDALLDPGEVEEQYAEALKKTDGKLWLTLSDGEKVRVLQSIIDYESTVVLGISPIALEACEMEEYIAGRYSNTERKIMVSSACLKDYEAEDIIKVVLHETRHAWQFSMVELYRSLSSSLDVQQLKLNVLRDAKAYESNLLSYSKYDGTDETYDAYNNQAIEVDSDEWAERTFEERYRVHVYGESSQEEIKTVKVYN